MLSVEKSAASHWCLHLFIFNQILNYPKQYRVYVQILNTGYKVLSKLRLIFFFIKRGNVNDNKAKTNSFTVELNKTGKCTTDTTTLKLFFKNKAANVSDVLRSEPFAEKSGDQWDTRAFRRTELPQSARLLSNRINVMDIRHSAFILHAVNVEADKQILVRGPPAQSSHSLPLKHRQI